MILIKSILISVLIVESIFCSFTDIRTGKIPNTAILCGIICAVSGNVIYFALSGSKLILSYIFNVASAALISFTMYALNIWAGGDVKLFILLSALIPAEFVKQKAPLSIATIYITVFSVAFIYLIIESAVLTIRRKKCIRSTSLKLSAKSVFSCMISIIAFQSVLRFAFQGYYYDYLSFFLLLNVIFVLVFSKIKFLSHNLSIMVCSIISVVSSIFSIANNQYKVDIKSILVTLVVICLRTLAEQFNYQEINTVDTKKGMILSYATVLGFANSRVKGLPKVTTEDISSRITQDEADSFVRWASSKNGKDKITILRKIPFAAFISIGFIIYLFLGVFVW